MQLRRERWNAGALVLLIDVDQQAARWNLGGLLQIRTQDLVVHFWQQDLCRLFGIQLLLAVQHQREQLQQVRFAGANEV